MRRWFRVVVPEKYLGIYLLIFLIDHGVRSAIGPHRGDEIVLLAGAVAFGCFRVAAFHPILRPRYASWLMTTPWTSNLPLPLGPVSPVPQDVVVILLATLVALRFPAISPGTVPLSAIAGYLIGLSICLFRTRTWEIAYTLAFGLGLLVRCWWMPPAAWGIAVFLCLCGIHGLNHSLRSFPWDLQWIDEPISRAFDPESAKRKMRERLLGWPFEYLKPDEQDAQLGLGHSILISLLVGWYLHVALILPLEHGVPRTEVLKGVGAILGTLGCLVPALRVLIFHQNVAPPISLSGRFLTGRWLIPGYDQAFVAPIVAAVVALGGNYLAWRHASRLELIFPATLTSTLLILTLGGPKLRTWKLTGTFRITPMLANRHEFDEL